VVILNAAAGLFVAGRVDSIEDGIRVAVDALDSGRARMTLDRMVRCSQEVAGV
jgi:anthranilate phosphoribosyltransferase